MEVKINQVVLHLLDPGASEPVLSDRAMDMDADLYEYYTATLERAFASDEVKNCRFLPDSAFAAEMAQNQEDLICIGTIGLIKAIDSFNPENGARFATYAGKCLQNEILMHFRSQKKTSGEVYINDPIDTDKDGNPLTYIDIIKVDDNIAAELDAKITGSKALRIIANELDERERAIIILRYGLSGKPAITQREVAQRLKISRSYVSRIEKSALEKIEARLKNSCF